MGVAQLVERRVVVADAAGSSPVTHPNGFPRYSAKGTNPLNQASFGNAKASYLFSPIA